MAKAKTIFDSIETELRNVPKQSEFAKLIEQVFLDGSATGEDIAEFFAYRVRKTFESAETCDLATIIKQVGELNTSVDSARRDLRTMLGYYSISEPDTKEERLDEAIRAIENLIANELAEAITKGCNCQKSALFILG